MARKEYIYVSADRTKRIAVEYINERLILTLEEKEIRQPWRELLCFYLPGDKLPEFFVAVSKLVPTISISFDLMPLVQEKK